MAKLWLILTIFILYGCAGNPGRLVEVGNKEQLKDCHLLKTFTEPGGYFVFGPPIMGNFKNEAIEKAEKMGATHILFRSELNGNGVEETNVIYAYKCPPGYNVFQNKEEEY